MQVVATKEEGLAELKKDAPPLILIVGELFSYNELLIAAEGEVILTITGGHLSALKCLFSFYYTLNFCYPKSCANTFVFIQKHLLQILDSNHTPVKVTVFVNELSN